MRRNGSLRAGTVSIRLVLVGGLQSSRFNDRWSNLWVLEKRGLIRHREERSEVVIDKALISDALFGFPCFASHDKCIDLRLPWNVFWPPQAARAVPGLFAR